MTQTEIDNLVTENKAMKASIEKEKITQAQIRYAVRYLQAFKEIGSSKPKPPSRMEDIPGSYTGSSIPSQRSKHVLSHLDQR